jgi:TatD DNase family protein
MYVDSHCHLAFDELHQRLDTLLQEMHQANVGKALCICTTLEEFARVHGLALAHPNLWATAGVHPDSEGIEEPTLDRLLALAALPRVVGIGETGLDYFRLNGRTHAQMQWQRDRFSAHIAAAKATQLPLIIHTRNASEDTLAMLRDEAQGCSGVFHCFTESQAVARDALDLGFLISFSGILSFKNAKELHEVAKWVPLDRCLIETDSPYLAPVPHRGKLNTPAKVVHVAQALAALKGITSAQVAEATTDNFHHLFKLVAT